MVKDLCVSRRSCKILPLFFKSLWPGASAGWAFFMFFFYSLQCYTVYVCARMDGWVTESFAQGRISSVGFKFLTVSAPIARGPICLVPRALWW